MSWKRTKPDFSFAKLSEKYSVSNYINSILLRIFNVVKFISNEKVTLDILCYAELIQYIYAFFLRKTASYCQFKGKSKLRIQAQVNHPKKNSRWRNFLVRAQTQKSLGTASFQGNVQPEDKTQHARSSLSYSSFASKIPSQTQEMGLLLPLLLPMVNLFYFVIAGMEIKPVNPKGNQPGIFIGRSDAEAEAPILWSPDAKSQHIGKDRDGGKDWELEGVIEDEMVR